MCEWWFVSLEAINKMHTLAIAVTNRCPLRCDFCCVPPGPGDINPQIAEDVVDQVINLKAFSCVGFTGGEPLLLVELVTRLGRKLADAGIVWGLTTGGGWATSKRKVESVVNQLINAGINNITVSVDESHLQWKSRDYIPFLLECLTDKCISTTISCTTSKDELDLPFVIAPSKFLKIEYHYISPVGYGRELDIKNHQRLSLEDSRCPMKNSLTLSLWPDGSIYPCCSTYVVNKEKELVIGNIKDHSLKDILDRALSDVYLCAIREVGFSGLIFLTKGAGIWNRVFSNPVIDVCHLCAKISSASTIPLLRNEILTLLKQDGNMINVHNI